MDEKVSQHLRITKDTTAWDIAEVMATQYNETASYKLAPNYFQYQSQSPSMHPLTTPNPPKKPQYIKQHRFHHEIIQLADCLL